MKLIIINGAPRMEKGNTQILLNPFLVGAKGAGADVDIAFLGHKKIKQCTGCFTCYAKTPGVCVHSDDMPGLADRIGKADAMILATPIYLDGMTALTKTFVDRLVIFLDPHFVKDDIGLIHPLRRNFPKKIFVVSVCGYTGTHNFEPLLDQVKKMSRNLHSDFAGALLRPGAFSLLMTKKYSEKVRSVLEAARLAGEEFVRLGHVSKEICQSAAADICSGDELMKAANSYLGPGVGRLVIWDDQKDFLKKLSYYHFFQARPGYECHLRDLLRKVVSGKNDIRFITCALAIVCAIVLADTASSEAGGILHMFPATIDGERLPVARPSVLIVKDNCYRFRVKH